MKSKGYVALRARGPSTRGALSGPGLVAPGRDDVSVRKGALGARVNTVAFTVCGFGGRDGWLVNFCYWGNTSKVVRARLFSLCWWCVRGLCPEWGGRTRTVRDVTDMAIGTF